MRRTMKTVMAGVVALGLAACEDTTAPSGGEATMRVAARGDDGPSASRAPGDGAAYSQALGSAEGSVDFRARVYVRTDAGQWVELTQRGAQQATVDAAGRAEAALVTAAGVRAASYNRVRVVFENVRANVSGGIYIGAGLLTGLVTVDLRSDGRAVVEREVDVQLAAGGTAALLVDLNADAWLSQASTQGGVTAVSEAAFESAVRVTAR